MVAERAEVAEIGLTYIYIALDKRGISWLMKREGESGPYSFQGNRGGEMK